EATNSTKYRYNAAGLPTIIQGPTGVQTTAVYNALGHKLSMSDPNQGTMAFVYNALGELRSQTDAVGTTTRFNYDKLGRTTTRAPSNGEAATSWVFDTLKKGQLSEESLSNGLFKKTYAYDALARMTQTTTTIEGTDYVQDTTLDPNFGRPTSTTSPDATRVFYHYKLNGFLHSESDSANPSAITLRTITATDKNGLITGAEYRNRLITTTSRTISGAITRICTTNAGANCATDNSAQHIQYENYDSFGNLGKRSNHSQAVTETFTYDVQDRLITTEKNGYAHNNGAVFTHYAYNNAGNLTKKTDFSTDLNGYSYGDDGANALKETGGPTSEDYAGPNAVSRVNLSQYALGLNTAGRYMDFAYDKNGNLTKKTLSYTPTAGTPSSMTYREIKYNSNNKPIEVSNHNGTTTYFYYGSDGMRYKQVVGDKTTYYVGGGVFEQESQAGTTIKRSYIGDFALRTVTHTASSTVPKISYLHRDRLGSIDTITDAADDATSNSVVAAMAKEQRSFNAFGKARTSTGAIESDGTEGTGLLPSGTLTPRGFTNHEHLGESGLIHMNGRAYDPDLGRFLSVDPIISMPDNGQSLNPYSYVMNNPLKYTDPSGYTLKERNEAARKAATAARKAGCDRNTCEKTTNLETGEVTFKKVKGNGANTSDSGGGNDKADAGSPTAPDDIDWANDPSITVGLTLVPGLPLPIILPPKTEFQKKAEERAAKSLTDILNNLLENIVNNNELEDTWEDEEAFERDVAAIRTEAKTLSKTCKCQVFLRGDAQGLTEFWAPMILNGDTIAGAQDMIRYELVEDLFTDHAQDSADSPYISITTSPRAALSYAGYSGRVYFLTLPAGMALYNPFNAASVMNKTTKMTYDDEEWLVPIHIPSQFVH
ncbi:MAG: RHS repeat-associated core domain-containing protein, partial [Algicola sp.]|nr:RHS repeat-associated core domain-containing protein [Algicola sp.]